MSSRPNRRSHLARLLTATAATAALALIASPAHAATVLWAGTLGDFTVPGNWNSAAVPTTADAAFINNGGTAQIDATMNPQVGSLTLGNAAGDVGNLTMSGGSLTTTNTDLRIGGNAATTGGTGTFTQTGGAVNLNAGNLNVGFGSAGTGAVGTYNISGGSLTVVSANIIAVGNRGTGTVNQQGGDIYIRNASNAAAGSLVNLGRNIAAGGGSGTWNLSAGSLTAQLLQFGNAVGVATSTNTFALSGTGKLIVNDIKIVNTAATNIFSMTGGTLVANQVTIPLNNQGGTLSPAFVAFSTANPTGATITDVGTTTFVGDNSYTQGAAGTLAIDLAGPGSFDVVSIGAGGNGTATLAGTVKVNLLAGYDPALGTTFDVLRADSITGTLVPVGLTPSGNAFAASTPFDPSDGRQVLRLTVVAAPEPGTFALAGLALSSFAFRRRRPGRAN